MNKLASSSIDLSAEFFRQLRNSNPEVLRRARLPDKKIQFISVYYPSKQMPWNKWLQIHSPPNKWIVLCQQPKLHSTKNVVMGQFPTLVTLHSEMDAEAYKACHFDIEHKSFESQNIEFEDIDDFYEKIPIVTMDFSLAMANGWLLSINQLAKRNFGPNARISKTTQEAMQGYCQVHFKSNVTKVSKVFPCSRLLMHIDL